MSFEPIIQSISKRSDLPPLLIQNMVEFVRSLENCLKKRGHPLTEREYSCCATILEKTILFYQQPPTFSHYHQAPKDSEDLMSITGDLFGIGVDKQRSLLEGKDSLEQIRSQIQRGENAILLGNHQSEADPQALWVLLHKEYQDLIDRMVFVAGHRVTTDPIAVPYSYACNLLCIYSKRHLSGSQEQIAKKREHNQATLREMGQLMKQGGLLLYIAPAGGRDRPEADGTIAPAPFDASSVEMLILTAQRSQTPTHFYPLSLFTHKLLAPPKTVQAELGEARIVDYTPIGASFRKEVDVAAIPGLESHEKRMRRQLRTDHLWQKVVDGYHELESKLS